MIDNTDNNLAIVIPAYKPDFLYKSLYSIANQSCLNFTVYIGDDNSPFDLGSVVREFKGKFDFVYRRFNYNMGGNDLVDQWERCIDLVRGEEWIWLFSDDDFMDSNCVECFYKTLNTQPLFDLYHFNVNVVDNKDQIIVDYKDNSFPEILDSYSFYQLRLWGKIKSYVVEYIFRKDTFLKLGRFPNFDLAWGSDVAMCVLLGQDKGIYTIPNAQVNWRRSDVNISPNNSSKYALRKLHATTSYSHWFYLFFKYRGQSTFLFNYIMTLKRFYNFSKNVPEEEIRKAIREYASIYRVSKFIAFSMRVILLFLKKIKK